MGSRVESRCAGSVGGSLRLQGPAPAHTLGRRKRVRFDASHSATKEPRILPPRPQRVEFGEGGRPRAANTHGRHTVCGSRRSSPPLSFSFFFLTSAVFLPSSSLTRAPTRSASASMPTVDGWDCVWVWEIERESVKEKRGQSTRRLERDRGVCAFPTAPRRHVLAERATQAFQAIQESFRYSLGVVASSGQSWPGRGARFLQTESPAPVHGPAWTSFAPWRGEAWAQGPYFTRMSTLQRPVLQSRQDAGAARGLEGACRRAGAPAMGESGVEGGGGAGRLSPASKHAPRISHAPDFNSLVTSPAEGEALPPSWSRR